MFNPFCTIHLAYSSFFQFDLNSSFDKYSVQLALIHSLIYASGRGNVTRLFIPDRTTGKARDAGKQLLAPKRNVTAVVSVR